MDAVEVLMVEDNRGDVVLVKEALAKEGLPYHLNVVCDGVEALDYLRHEGKYAGVLSPGLIVLDLKLPRRGGRELLDIIGSDPVLHGIPIVLLSSSQSELELAKLHNWPANSYMVKPSTFSGYLELVRAMESFRRAGSGVD